jgi:DNA polymerase-3 subunit gamma/tau
MPLHTTHRPASLDDIIGNESVVDSLKSVLAREKDKPHSYLFTGNAGCGKTSLSRILKTELGCSDSDYSLYNSANLRGIDTVRDIQDSCQFAPMNGKIKLFSLEECHQLTGPAQEALLVLLEEPPDHVYFVLCTTEPEKLKPTIKRRCHSYEVKPLNTIQLNKLINRTLQQENVTTFPEEVIQKIISVCDGSPGKALNLLDTVIDLTNDDQAFKAIDEATVSESNIAEIARMLLSGRGQLQSIAKMIDGLSGEPESLRYAFLGYFSKVLLNSKPGQEDRISEIMLPFMDSIMYSQKGGLVMEIYLAFRASKI